LVLPSLEFRALSFTRVCHETDPGLRSSFPRSDECTCDREDPQLVMVVLSLVRAAVRLWVQRDAT
jgi:hypothetical protein